MDETEWTIREGSGLVLPLHGRLIEFTSLFGLNELDLEVAAAHLRVALRLVERQLKEKKDTLG